MRGFIALAFIVLFVIQFIGTVIYLVQLARLLRRLESNHKAVHESLGSPSLVLNNTPRNNLLVLGWIWRREFGTIDDSKTIALARLVRMLFLVLACSFVAMLLLFVTFFFS